MGKIVDISTYNVVTSYPKLAVAADIVVVRIGYRGYSAGNIKEDGKFSTHVKGLAAAGETRIGAYFMSQAINVAEAEAEADYCYNAFKSYYNGFPIFYDSEYSNTNKNGRADGLTKSQRTVICKAFCDRLISHGMKAGVYASEDWFKNKLNLSELITDYYIWVAKYGSNTGVAQTKPSTESIDAWQYTSNGSIDGISGKVDLTIMYTDFATEKPDGTPISGTTSTPSTPATSGAYTQAKFISDMRSALGLSASATAAQILAKTVTISTSSNKNHKCVTPLERYMKVLGYYSGSIEADQGKTPAFGRGMYAATIKYQKSVVGLKNGDGIWSGKTGKSYKKALGV